jgi:ABC-2 type transport system permease protein
MIKLMRIAWYEYSRHVFRWRFLLSLLSLPMMLVFFAIVLVIVALLLAFRKPIGYVDYSGLLTNASPPNSVVAYKTEADARAALESGEIQAYYLLPEDYLKKGEITLIYVNEPNNRIKQGFIGFLNASLLASLPEETAQAITHGTNYTLLVLSAQGDRPAATENLFALIYPLIGGILFITSMNTSSGYLMWSVVEEKESRTIEIMVTSVSPGQFMGGKILGDMAIGLTTLLVYISYVAIPVVLLGGLFPQFIQVDISWGLLALLVAELFPAFVMECSLLAAVASTVAEPSEGSAFGSFITLPIWIPSFLIIFILQNPNSPLALGLSFFPLTAPLTMAMRAVSTTIPVWQIIVSVLVTLMTAVAALWLAGRAFRLGMVRYGKRVRFSELFSRQKGPVDV